MLNAAVQRMVMAALWLSPLGIGSLIAASLLRACDLLGGWEAQQGDIRLWVGDQCGEARMDVRCESMGRLTFCVNEAAAALLGPALATRAPHGRPTACLCDRRRCHLATA